MGPLEYCIVCDEPLNVSNGQSCGIQYSASHRLFANETGTLTFALATVYCKEDTSTISEERATKMCNQSNRFTQPYPVPISNKTYSVTENEERKASA